MKTINTKVDTQAVSPEEVGRLDEHKEIKKPEVNNLQTKVNALTEEIIKINNPDKALESAEKISNIATFMQLGLKLGVPVETLQNHIKNNLSTQEFIPSASVDNEAVNDELYNTDNISASNDEDIKLKDSQLYNTPIAA